ncbi:MAG: hypothetical protein CVT86_01480 [Alphaproteobacteria bacterium HGW-Alphaproteobacteria-8]|nr:MAG: hypothetical protein CVT86_01480 [Alphaproteobacteria bacterium HGW-Alphaproteobacteria-8]
MQHLAALGGGRLARRLRQRRPRHQDRGAVADHHHRCDVRGDLHHRQCCPRHDRRRPFRGLIKGALAAASALNRRPGGGPDRATTLRTTTTAHDADIARWLLDCEITGVEVRVPRRSSIGGVWAAAAPGTAVFRQEPRWLAAIRRSCATRWGLIGRFKACRVRFQIDPMSGQALSRAQGTRSSAG